MPDVDKSSQIQRAIERQVIPGMPRVFKKSSAMVPGGGLEYVSHKISGGVLGIHVIS